MPQKNGKQQGQPLRTSVPSKKWGKQQGQPSKICISKKQGEAAGTTPPTLNLYDEKNTWEAAGTTPSNNLYLQKKHWEAAGTTPPTLKSVPQEKGKQQGQPLQNLHLQKKGGSSRDNPSNLKSVRRKKTWEAAGTTPPTSVPPKKTLGSSRDNPSNLKSVPQEKGKQQGQPLQHLYLQKKLGSSRPPLICKKVGSSRDNPSIPSKFKFLMFREFWLGEILTKAYLIFRKFLDIFGRPKKFRKSDFLTVLISLIENQKITNSDVF